MKKLTVIFWFIFLNIMFFTFIFMIINFIKFDDKKILYNTFPLLDVGNRVECVDLYNRKNFVKNVLGILNVDVNVDIGNDNDFVEVEFGENMVVNHTSYEIDLEKLLNEPLDKNISSEILIYHTHTSEAYVDVEGFRTINSDNNVVSVGKKLCEELAKLKLKVNSSDVIHDYPEYEGSYDRSLMTIENLLSISKSNSIVIDIHRDAVENEPEKFRLCTEIDGNEVAQLMLVVGTNAGGLSHDNWIENLKFALKLQKLANDMYPGLFRSIDLREQRFNQHVSKGAILLEVGGTGNTLDEAKLSQEYFSKILKRFIDENLS